MRRIDVERWRYDPRHAALDPATGKNARAVSSLPTSIRADVLADAVHIL